jgi:hypothetical protein
MPHWRTRTDYSAVSHLGFALFGENNRRKLSAMFTAYFDDSGHPDRGPELVVGGYISTVEKWVRFEEEWSEVLELFDVEYFHMKEFAHSTGEFSGWKGNDGRRIAFLKRLAKVIRRRVLASVSSAMLMNDFRAVDEIYALSEFVSPYPICGVNSQHKSIEWLKEHNLPVEHLKFVYEDGTKDKGKFVDLADNLRFPIPSFEPKRKFRALEAADFIAWELGKIIRDVDKNTLRIRASVDELRKNMPRMWGIYRKEDLLRFCKAQGLPLRSSLKRVSS